MVAAGQVGRSGDGDGLIERKDGGRLRRVRGQGDDTGLVLLVRCERKGQRTIRALPYLEPRKDGVVQLGHVLDGAELGVVPELALEKAEIGDAGRVSYGTSEEGKGKAYRDAPMARETPFITGLLSSSGTAPGLSHALSTGCG